MRRIKKPGVTAVSARPLQGKTRLFEQLVDKIRLDVQDKPEYLVGYTEGRRDIPDLLLRAVQDLYSYWLGNSTWLEQARVCARQHGAHWPDKFGQVGQALAEVLKLQDPSGNVTKAAQYVFTCLSRANQKLETGGLELPLLSYELAHDLLAMVHEVTSLPLVLILDATEQLRNPSEQLNTVERYLGRSHQWPPVHFLLACREPSQCINENTAYQVAADLETQSCLASLYSLGGMDIDDLVEHDRLISYLHETIPVTKQIETGDLLVLLDHYPGTLRRWQQAQPTDKMQLLQLAKDAQSYRYRELFPIFESLYSNDLDLFDIAARMALLPESVYRGTGNPYESIVLGESSAEALDHLSNCGFLERSDDGAHYSFGLTSRYYHAKSTFLNQQTWSTRRSILGAELVTLLTSQINAWNDHAYPYLVSLMHLSMDDQHINLDRDSAAFCRFVYLGLSGEEWTDQDMKMLANVLSYVSSNASSAPLASMLICKYLFFARNEWVANYSDKYGDAILDPLRDITSSYSINSTVREYFAVGISLLLEQVLISDIPKLRDKLIDELRVFASSYSDDEKIRKVFVGELLRVGTFLIRSGKSDKGRALLIEGATIVEKYPNESDNNSVPITDEQIREMLKPEEPIQEKQTRE